MASFSLSNCTLFSPRPSSKTLDSTFLFQPLHNPHPRTRLCNSSSSSSLSFSLIPPSSSASRSFISFLSARDTVANTSKYEDDRKTVEKGGGQQHEYSLETLINIYKEAFLNGDKKTVSDVEARLQIIEREKSRLFQKVSDLSTEITTGKEKHKRLQADFDNFRKRSEKERHTVQNRAQKEVIESLLPMIDNFEKARKQINPRTEKEKKIDASYQSIYKQFVEALRSWRVSVVATVGRPFDPSLHEAVEREESQEIREGIIIQEFRRGFLLGERVLRPARVKVSKGPGRKKSLVVEQPSTAAGVDEH